MKLDHQDTHRLEVLVTVNMHSGLFSRKEEKSISFFTENCWAHSSPITFLCINCILLYLFFYPAYRFLQ